MAEERLESVVITVIRPRPPPARRRCPVPAPSQSRSNHGRVRAAAPPRLDPEQELRIREPLAAVVQEHGVDAVAEGEPHPGGDEDVVPAVGVDVADAQPPGPVVLGPQAVGDLLELPPPRFR